MKRILWLLAATSLVLSACQPDPAPADPTAIQTTGATLLPAATRTPRPSGALPARTPTLASRIQIQPEDLKGIDLLFWHPWTGAAAAEVQTLVGDFNRSNAWGIQIRTRTFASYDTLFTALQTTEAGDEKPDILAAPLHQLYYLEQNSASLSNLEVYMQDPTWGLTPDQQADFFPVFWQQGFKDGRRLAITAQSSSSLIYYNQTWAKELGFTRPPGSAAQFEEQACAAAQVNQSDDDQENDSTGGWIVNTSYPAALSWLYAYDAEIQDSQDGYRFNTTPVRQSFTFLRSLYEQGCAWLPEDEYIEEEFAARRGLFASGSMLGIRNQEDAFAKAGSRDDWTVLPYPGRSGPGAITVYGDAFAVPSSTPQRQLAGWLFIRWMLQPENQVRLLLKTGAYPLHAAVLAEIQTRTPLNQWQQSVDLLDVARSEPDLASWLTVRWVVSDIATQLFRWYFTLEQLPASVRLLDQTAAELHQMSIGGLDSTP